MLIPLASASGWNWVPIIYSEKRTAMIARSRGTWGRSFSMARIWAPMPGHPVLVGLDHLVVAAVHGKERVLKTGEYGLVLSVRLYMDGKDAESRGFPAGDPRNAIMPADQLKGMTDKKDMLGYSLLRSGAIPGDRQIVLLHFVQPAEIIVLPFAVLTFQGTAGTAAGDIKIGGQVWDFLLQPHFEFVEMDLLLVGGSVLPDEFPQTAHTLIGLALVQIQDRNPYFTPPVHTRKVRNYCRALGVPLHDLVEIVFEAVSDGDDLFTDINLVAGDGIDMA